MTDVLFEKRPDGVALITLNRPDSLNAMSDEVVLLLGQYLEECERGPDGAMRGAHGNGRGFCAGGDVRGMQSRNDAAAGGREGGPPNPVTVIDRLTAGLRRSHDATTLKLHTMPKRRWRW